MLFVEKSSKTHIILVRKSSSKGKLSVSNLLLAKGGNVMSLNWCLYMFSIYFKTIYLENSDSKRKLYEKPSNTVTKNLNCGIAFDAVVWKKDHMQWINWPTQKKDSVLQSENFWSDNKHHSTKQFHGIPIIVTLLKKRSE